MDAQQALDDLTEISSQIQTAVVFGGDGRIAASTTAEEHRAHALAEGATRLLDEAARLAAAAAPLTQVEAATSEGSVFVVADGDTRVAATTGPEPTAGLVFYDLKSALRSIREQPAPRKRRAGPKKDAAAEPRADKPPPKKAAPRKPPAKRPAAKKKPDAP